MKAILVAATLALTTPALAAMPVSGVYGTPMGCAAYLNADAFGDVEDILYVTDERVLGLEWGCLPAEIRGDNVTLTCEADEGSFYSETVTIRENRDGTLTYGDRTLRHCLPTS